MKAVTWAGLLITILFCAVYAAAQHQPNAPNTGNAGSVSRPICFCTPWLSGERIPSIGESSRMFQAALTLTASRRHERVTLGPAYP